MTYAYAQKTENSNQSFAATPIACPAITTTAGNLLLVAAMSFDGNITITDGAVGNTYTSLGFVATPTSGGRITLFYAKNIAGASTTIQLNTTGPWIQGVAAWEYSGLDTSAPYITGTFVGQSQATPGTATDACTSTNSNITAVPAMQFGFNWDENNASSNTPVAGTGFTGRGQIWKPLGSGGAFFTAQAEDKRVTSTGNSAATFTSAAGGTDTLVTITAAFTESTVVVTPPGAPFSGHSQVFVNDFTVQF